MAELPEPSPQPNALIEALRSYKAGASRSEPTDAGRALLYPGTTGEAARRLIRLATEASADTTPKPAARRRVVRRSPPQPRVTELPPSPIVSSLPIITRRAVVQRFEDTQQQRRAVAAIVQVPGLVQAITTLLEAQDARHRAEREQDAANERKRDARRDRNSRIGLAVAMASLAVAFVGRDTLIEVARTVGGFAMRIFAGI